MPNPFRAIRGFVTDNADRLRDTARETVERGLELLQESNDRPPPEEAPDDSTVASDASVAFGRDVEPGEKRPSETKRPPEATSPPDESTDDGGEDGTETIDGSSDEETPTDETSENSRQGVGVLFDTPPRSIRHIRPLQTARDHHRRRTVVTAGRRDGQRRDNRRDDGRADVTLDVSRLGIDKLELEVEDLDAQVALQARIAELVDVNVGASVELGEVELDLEGVDAEALLEVNLDEIREIFGQTLETLRERPELITDAYSTAEKATKQLGKTTREATDEVGDTTREATDEIGETTDDVAPSIEAESHAEYDGDELPGDD